MKISANFSREEIACKCGCGFDCFDKTLNKALEKLRSYFNSPVIITSGNRCFIHNKMVHGSPKSHHMRGMAADIVVKDVAAFEVQRYLRKEYPDTFGIGFGKGFTHLDVREKRARWSYENS